MVNSPFFRLLFLGGRVEKGFRFCSVQPCVAQKQYCVCVLEVVFLDGLALIFFLEI